jgi:hypothetical protein
MLSDRELDQLIDAALPGYSAAEPRSGLEDRILTRSLAEHPRRKRFGWAWALAVPVAACLLVFLFIVGRHRSYRSTLEATATTAPATTAASPRETPATDSFPSPRKRSVRRKESTQTPTTREVLPKEEVFPSPSKLTAQEQSLIAYNVALLRATTTHPDTRLEINPLIISELEIKPLDIPALEQPASNPSESIRNEQQP